MTINLHFCADVGIKNLIFSLLGCKVNNCLNGATCKPLTNGDLCICARGYWGQHCERSNSFDNVNYFSDIVTHTHTI